MEDYYDACIKILETVNIDNVNSLHLILLGDAPILSNSTTQDVIEHIFRFLQASSNSTKSNIERDVLFYSCTKLLLQFRLKSKNGIADYNDLINKLATFFRNHIQVQAEKNEMVCVLIGECTLLWCEILQLQQIEHEYLYLLALTALQWIFSRPSSVEYELTSHKFSELVSVCFLKLDKQRARDQLLHDILSFWFKSGEQFSSKVAELVLGLVAVAGQCKVEVLLETKIIHDKSKFELEANLRHQSALSTAGLISRRIIDFAHSHAGQRKCEIQNFLVDIGLKLHSPNWPTAEVFVSAFLTTLFKYVDVVRSKKYPLFLFSCLRIVQKSLNFRNIENVNIPSLVLKAIKNCTKSQALYLATRQCVLPKQPWLAYLEAVNEQVPDHDIANEWDAFLQQWPIATYYSEISKTLNEIALMDDLKEANQIELFKVLETTSIFDLRWLDRLSYATPGVCESLVPLVAKHATPESVEQLCIRVAAPGASSFKKKVLQFLINSKFTMDCWKTALLCAADGDLSVKQAGIKACKELFAKNGDLPLVFTGAESVLLHRGLSVFIEHNAERLKIQELIRKLIHGNKFELCIQFLKVDGALLPSIEIPILFELSIDPSFKDRERVLQIIALALSSRPRVILAQPLVSKMFQALLSRLAFSSELEINHIGSILGDIVQLDTLKNQSDRRNILMKIVEYKSLPTAVKYAKINDNMSVLIQSVLICGCLRFWTSDPEKLLKLCHTLIKLESSIVELKARLAIIRCVFRIASQHSVLFSDATLNTFFKRFGPLTPEAECVTSLLLQHMWEHGSKPLNDPKHTSRECFFGREKNSSEQAETATSIMLQQHISRILESARSEENINSLRVISKALEDNMAIMDECIPTVTFLSFSTKPGVSPTALRAFKIACDKSPNNLGIKFVEGLTLIKEDISTLNSNVFPLMWSWFRSNVNQKDVKYMLEQFCKKILKFNTPLHILKLVITGLSNSEMPLKDAKSIVLLIETELNRFEPTSHTNNECIAMILVHVFSYWLRRRYNFSEYSRHTKFMNSKTEDADLEPMQCELIIERFSERMEAGKVLHELWGLPDYYGTDSMNEKVYGKMPIKRARYK